MARSIADGRYKVDLSADWRPYAEPLPSLRMLGTFKSARGIVCALAQRPDGAYVAVQGRMVTMLAQHKIPHAIAEWRASMGKMPFSARFDT